MKNDLFKKTTMTYVSIRSGATTAVMTFHRVSGLKASMPFGTRPGNHSAFESEACICSWPLLGVLAPVTSSSGIGDSDRFPQSCWAPGGEPQERSNKASRRGRPDVSPCQRLHPCSSQYI